MLVLHLRNWARDYEASDGGTPPLGADMTVMFLFICFWKINLVIPPPQNLLSYIWIWVC